MKTSLGITNPHGTEFTLHVTMTLGDWLKLQEQLAREYPSLELTAAIKRMVTKARQEFLPSEETADANAKVSD